MFFSEKIRYMLNLVT